MNIEEPHFGSPSNSKFIFPKLSLKDNAKGIREVQVFSNHFKIALPKDLEFNEWLMRFYSKEEAEKHQDDLSEAEEAIPADSRVLISEVYYTNKQAITEALGFSFTTGKTLYSVGKIKELRDKYFFRNHSKYVMSIDLKNKATSFNTLIPNE